MFFYFKPRNHETFIVDCIVCLLYLLQNKGTDLLSLSLLIVCILICAQSIYLSKQ